jgi:hypothetical protein
MTRFSSQLNNIAMLVPGSEGPVLTFKRKTIFFYITKNVHISLDEVSTTYMKNLGQLCEQGPRSIVYPK